MGRDKRLARQQKKAQGYRDRAIKQGIAPDPQKTPKLRDVDGVDNDATTVQWCFRCFDYGYDWRINKGNVHASFLDVAEHLKGYSIRTWQEIKQNARRDHPIPFPALSKPARDRLEVLGLDDYDELWRFRFNGPGRLWGIKDGHMFRVLWWDPDHQVYPVEA